MRAELLLEQDAAQNCSDGAVQRCNRHDNTGISRGRGGVEADDIGDGGEGAANCGAQHHHAAGLRGKRLAQIAQLMVLCANENRPYAAEQVVDSGGKRCKRERDGERAQRLVAIAPCASGEPFAPYALRFRKREKTRVKSVAYARSNGERDAARHEASAPFGSKRFDRGIHVWPFPLGACPMLTVRFGYKGLRLSSGRSCRSGNRCRPIRPRARPRLP